jgi:hypothetical protein
MSHLPQLSTTQQIIVPGPSCDEQGRITYTPTVKGYRPATEELIGKRVDIITDLNTSEVMRIKRDGHNAKQLITRVYSSSSKDYLKMYLL